MFHRACLLCACLSLVCNAYAEEDLVPLEVEQEISEDELLFDAIAAIEDIDFDEFTFDDEGDLDFDEAITAIDSEDYDIPNTSDLVS